MLCVILGFAAAVRADEPCAEVCRNVSAESAQNRCYSCQCKNALDGWLPSPADLPCSRADEIVVYRSNAVSPLTLEPITTATEECHNPSLIGGSCSPGSRLGQLTHGDIAVKWICRRNTFTPQYSDATVPFDKISIIGHNRRTGATCFWETNGYPISGQQIPSLDIAEAPAPVLAAYQKHFSGTEGAGCLYCHDNDPFLFTPYLKSVAWVGGSHTSGPFAKVILKGAPANVGYRQLTAPDARACTACHRIANGRSCNGWSQDAFGDAKDYGYENSVLAALDRTTIQNGVIVRQAGIDWSLAYWMPPKIDPNKTDWKQWHGRYGKAKETVLKCCREVHAGISSPECSWAPIPGYAP